MQARRPFDTGVHAGRNDAALKRAEPSRPGRLPPRTARSLAAVLLVAFAAILALPLQAEAQTQAQTAGVCGRTQQVRTAILGRISGVTACADVTNAHLAAITGTLDFYDSGITALAAGDFDGLTALTSLNLSHNSLSTLPAGVFDELTALTTLRLGVNSLSPLPAGVFDELTALTLLDLDGNSLLLLPAGVFDELTALTHLSLEDNSLSALSVDIFDELTALETLDLDHNSLSSLSDDVFDELTALRSLSLGNNFLGLPWTLRAGVFDELTSLTTLSLHNNDLAELPAGMFEELTALTSLELRGNPGAPFSPTADALPDDGEVSFVGGTVTLDGSASDGGPWGTNVTYSWRQTSGPTSGVTFDDAASATTVVTVPALADGTEELTFTLTVTPTPGGFGFAPDTDTATVTAVFDSTLGICGRTEAVRDGIVALVSGVINCAFVTDAHLGAITGKLSLFNRGITALAAGDFDELTALTELGLSNNSLSTLPAGVFDELTALTWLSLHTNSLSTLPAGVFDGLTALTGLWLSFNSLSTLPADVFDGLTALDELGLSTNSLSTLPADVFDGLTALDELGLSNNSLSSLPAGVFDELTALTQLYLGRNSLTSLPDDVFENLTALTFLDLRGNPGAPFSPTADALPDDGTVLVGPGGTVTLDGSGSGPWGTNVTYSWALTSPASGVTFDDAASATPVVTIPALADGAELTFTLTVNGRGDYNDINGIDPDTDTATVTGEFDPTLGICGRTEQVRDAIVALVSGAINCALVTDAHLAAITGGLHLFNRGITALAAGDFDGLTALTVLNLRTNSLSTLPAGVFEDLTALTELSLRNNSLSTLPAGVFDNNTALTTLYLNNNSLSTLPAGVFDNNTALTTLYLDYNNLSTLPAGVFEELTALTALRLDGNPGAPFSPTADALPDDGEVLPAGGDVTLDGSGSDGGPWGTNVTYSWRQTSGPTSGVTFDDDANATPVVTIPALTAGAELTFTLTVTGRATRTGWGAAPDTDTATVTVTDPTAGICGRTQQVRTAILGKISGVTDCADVTDAHLAAITGTLSLQEDGITALAAGDFDGLTAVSFLHLDYNSLETLPDDVFDELTALTRLALGSNSLDTLPAGVFEELTALTSLGLSFNSLSTLPAGVFEELTALTTLRLEGNPGAPFSPTAVALPDDGTVLPAGGTVTLDGSGSDGGAWGTNVTYSWAASGATVTFDDAASATPVVTIPALTDGTELTFTLTVTGRATNTTNGTAPDTDTATVTVTAFDPTLGICGRTEEVRDAIVAKISVVIDCADVTDTHLAAITGTLDLSAKGITALAAGDFDGLTSLMRLSLWGNSLTELPAGVFDELSSLTLLGLGSNSLTTLPDGVFAGLTALSFLYLDTNSLETLPDDVFDELTALTVLGLGSNALTTLSADVFDELTAV